MAWVLQQFRDDPNILKGFTHKDRVPCICGRCGTEHTHSKRVVELAVAKESQGHLFCTRSCSSARQGTTWEIRDGVQGRVCKSCQQWTPQAHLHDRRGWICNTCTARQPRFRFRSYKGRAVKSSIPFVLSYQEFLQHWQKPCSYCGSPIETIGLDRKDNTRGYTPDNVTPCCPDCNWMKGGDTTEVFLARCVRVAERHPC